MTKRSANESIKGYSYQFDHTIVQILECNNPETEFVIEGIEDVDVLKGNLSTFVQCKYYEGTDYNHSKIKPAVISMLKHFRTLINGGNSSVQYKIYGHFKEGQEKLPNDFNLDFLKRSLLTYVKDGTTHKVYNQLGLTDIQLEQFNSSLDIDLYARTYDEQRAYIINNLLLHKIPSCMNREDSQLFFYPSAATVIQAIAIRKNIGNCPA